ncbi:MAG: glycosyltransferase family 4 protein [Chloroflexi bacterium]|nr:glycosyltransferase family 4 protein [Chloroflexota bacterium]MCC6892592.1 glycosyltransferase [Anaerolineae bacterium]
MHILFLSWWWPYPANNGAKIRIYNLLRHLSEQHQVTLLSFAEADEATPEQIAHMRGICQRVEVVAKPRYQPGALKATLGYLSRWPRSLVDVYSTEMEVLVKRVCASGSVDVIIASQFQTMRYFDAVPYIPAILEEIETTIFHNQVQQASGQASRLRAQMTLTKFESVLRQFLERGVAFTVVSEAERHNIERFAPPQADIRVVPNGVDTQANQPNPAVQRQPQRLIYTGAVTYAPNHEAVRFFIKEVWPLVRAAYPQAEFRVTGGTGDVDVKELASAAGVTFTGYLPSVAEAVQASTAMVVPLRSGGGTRLKILEAMALGTPVISTRKGAEGISIHDGQDILLADTPEQMAAAVRRVFTEADLHARLAKNARTLAQQTYDWGMIANQLHTLIHDISQSDTLVKENG